MRIVYDEAKNDRNVRERGLSFERVADFDFGTALIIVDDRRDYGESRQIAIGYLEDRLHVLCFVERPSGIRVISFRKANKREVRRYAQAQTTD
ncbi:MAG TPA: BrnT family toxin [Reyranellaceae bacterium]|nr:BrnT family toxin [Reyranellaceae bacterium]